MIAMIAAIAEIFFLRGLSSHSYRSDHMETRLQRSQASNQSCNPMNITVSNQDAKIVDGLFSRVANQIKSSMAIPYLLTSILKKTSPKEEELFPLKTYPAHMSQPLCPRIAQ